MKFIEFSQYLEKLEKTSSRINITEILADLFSKSDKNEIDKIVYLSLGRLAPSYVDIVFNIAERMVLQIISQAYGVDLEEVKKVYKKKGDLGDVVTSISSQKGKGLKVEEVYSKLLEIAQDEGEGSQERKIEKTAKLLSSLDAKSAKFVVRVPLGKLRLGFSDKTILDALSWMEEGNKSLREVLEKAYFVLPDVGLLAKNVKKYGIKKATKKVNPSVGVPVLPMLAQRLKSPSEMIEKMNEVVVEPKFDGLRISLHYKKGKNGFVKAFTRNLNETSWMFPELKNIEKYICADEVILDTEAVGVDEKRKSLANFQETMTRRRKHDIEKYSSQVPIRFYVFDLLFKNGKNYMNKAYVERRDLLEKTVKDGSLLRKVDYKITSDPQDIKKMMRKELMEGLEGIIVKKADSKYVPGRTGWRWVKMKEEESKVARLADTMDCVVMGYSVGKGRRAQFGVGQFLVGVRDDGKIRTVSKIGTGIKDEQFKEIKKRLSKIEIGKKPKEYVVDKGLEPDYWIEPLLVVEIAADEITKSPRHTSKYALRFPRLVKFRSDKDLNQATSISELKKLFKLQR